MPPKSLEAGDYTLVMVLESGSRPDSFYRVCARVDAPAELSCDCPRWTFQRHGEAGRSCPHTTLAARLLANSQHVALHAPSATRPNNPQLQPMMVEIGQQWPGLTGSWFADTKLVDDHQLVMIGLETPDGRVASGVVGFSRAHGPTLQSMRDAVAGWCGWSIASTLLRSTGFPLTGRMPAHFRPERSSRRQGASGGTADVLNIGNRVNLGDGLRPAQRAENTLRLILGDVYSTLERQQFLDVPSRAHPGRIYRLRRDPNKQRERRLRVFENGHYVKDFCVVRAQDVPEADHYLTVFLRLFSDEAGVLHVVKAHNVFPCYSDGREQETVPPLVMQRAA